jgi:hypothetical protein
MFTSTQMSNVNVEHLSSVDLKMRDTNATKIINLRRGYSKKQTKGYYFSFKIKSTEIVNGIYVNYISFFSN